MAFAPSQRPMVPKGDRIARQIDCPECHAIFAGAITCPECGYRLRPVGRAVATLPGNLVEIGRPQEDRFDRARFYGELRGIASERGYKPTWAACVFRERFDEWPPREWSSNPILEPLISTRRWIKSRSIAYAKSKRAEGVSPPDLSGIRHTPGATSLTGSHLADS